MKKKKKNIWKTVIIVLVILFLLSFLLSGIIGLFSSNRTIGKADVALIPIKGVIVGDKGGFFDRETTASTKIVKFIEEADKNPNIKAIIFEINSPGGSAVASDEIATAIKKTNKTTVAWIREAGTSGAYWIASSTDHIIANKMSITGSIGVIASYLQYSGLLDIYNVSYERLVSGKFKDIGSPFRGLSQEERLMFQKNLDKIRLYFIEEIAENRNLDKENVKKLANGMFYLGAEAKELGLVDELGGKDEVTHYIEKKLNITASIAEYKERRTFLDVIREVMSKNFFFIGRGIGAAIFDKQQEIKINF